MNVPKRYQAGLSRIKTLDGRTIAEFQAVLNGIKYDYRRPDGAAIEAVSSAFPGRPDLRDVAEAIASVYRLRMLHDASVEEFADDICDAMQSIGADDLRLRSEERPEFG